MKCGWVVAVLVVFLVVLGAASNAFAQGFMVKPMKLEIPARPGDFLEAPLELRVTAGDRERTLELKLVDLTQDNQGTWSIVEPGGPDVDVEKLATCKDWIKLTEAAVTIRPAESATVGVQLRVPQRARGTYFAGILAQSRPEKQQGGVAVVVRFLIPVIVSMQGVAERQNVVLNAVELTPVDAVPGVSAASTKANLSISNEGRTFPRIKGQVKVQRLFEGRWRPVSVVDIREVGIIPGVTLNLAEDMKKRLPSGKYKLSGLLYVDGRRVNPLEKEIDFVGDPGVTTLAVDTALTLQPEQIDIVGSPGSTRSAVLQVTNDSQEAVTIETGAGIPPSLRGVALGSVTGDQMSGAAWLQITPANFTIRGGGKQNVRVVAKLPREGMVLPNYYGLLTLKATYPDGQSAGTTNSLVTIQNQKVESTPQGQVARISVAADAGATNIITTKVSNVGNVHATPVVKGTLINGMGEHVIEIGLEGDASPMLPLATRDFAGVMDFEKIPDGAYMLRVEMSFGQAASAREQIPVQVSTVDSAKVVTVVEAAATQPTTGSATQPATQPVP